MKIFLIGLIAVVGIGVALAGATYAGLLRVPTDFFVGASQQSGR
jgi:hypothetical protein